MRLIDADALKKHIDKLPALTDGNFAGNHSALKALVNMQPTIKPSPNSSEIPNGWIPCTPETMPECEQEVLICTKKKVVGKNAYIDSIITPALYEDGTMLEIDSKWRWEDIDYDKWDEESDCGIIPEGWWENRHFNPDDVYNNVVDREVVAWMPLPKPYGGEQE